VREGATLPPWRLARFGPYIALVTIAASLGLMLIGLFVGALSTKERLIALGVGSLAVFLGVAMLAPTLVPPVAKVLGWPATKIGGAAGMLARGNSIRNPQRTASTASALMIGLTLVTLVSVLAAGLKTTFADSVNKLFTADYALTSQNGFAPTSTASEVALRHLPGVEFLAGVRAAQGKAFGNRIGVTGVPADISNVIDVKWQDGSPATPGQLGSDGAFVSKDYAKSHHLQVGSAIDLQTPTGRTLHLKLRGIFAPPKGGSPYGDVTISTTSFDKAFANPQNLFAFLRMRGGVTAETRELGMLRAVGTTRRQVRRMIRHESIITALIGATLGIPLGVVLALMIGKAISYPAFTIPWATLVIFVVAAIIAGIVAAIFPARRAARLNVLEALQYE
jgi:putative ABC transport system permease protein